jgi:ankyrin repeat protein
MEALDPKSPAAASGTLKQTKSRKNIWASVKNIFTKTPENPPKKYANYKTPKLLPENNLNLFKRLPESHHVVYRDHKQFLEIDDFTKFIRETRPKPQTLNDFQKILNANASYLNQKDSHGKTPLRVAVESNNEEAVEFFLSDLLHYLDPYHEKHTQLVLFKAIENKNFRIIELMIQPGFIVYGEQLKMRNEKGKNAAEFALEQYKKAPPEHKTAAWGIAYFVVPDLPAYPDEII